MRGETYGIDEEASHDCVPLASVFIFFIGATVDLLEIT